MTACETFTISILFVLTNFIENLLNVYYRGYNYDVVIIFV